MKNDILTWLSEYGEDCMSFIKYLIEKYNIAGQVLKILLDICIEDLDTKERAALEITKYFIDDTTYLSLVSDFWNDLPQASRELILGLDSYPKIYGFLNYLECNSKNNVEPALRRYCNYIVYCDIIESTYNIETITTFTKLISLNKDVCDFLGQYLYDKHFCRINEGKSLILIYCYFDILKLNDSDLNNLYTNISLIHTSIACKLINKLYFKYQYNVEKVIKYYDPLLNCTDKEILEQVVIFWNSAIDITNVKKVFNNLFYKAHIEESIYFLLEKISEKFYVALSSKKNDLVKKDYKMMTHMYLFTISDLFKLINTTNFDDVAPLIQKLINKQFICLLPYIGEILVGCIINIKKHLEIAISIIHKLDEEPPYNVNTEVWNLYLNVYKRDIKKCKEEIYLFIANDLKNLDFYEKVKLLKILKNFYRNNNEIINLLEIHKKCRNEYKKYKFDLEIASHINHDTDLSLIRKSNTYISKLQNLY